MESNTLISFFVSLVLIVVLVALEFLLSTRRNRWWGLIPIAAAAAVVICLNVSLLAAANSYTTKTLTEQDGEHNRFTISLRYDKKGELIDFSDLQVRDENGALIDEVYLSFDKSGKLESDSDRAIYQETVDRLLDGIILTGVSDGDAVEGNLVPLGDGLFVDPNSHFYLEVLWVIFPMLPVYVIGRLTVRSKRRKAELKKLQVENL